MKTKLLKKIKKRFQIIHMPDGFTSQVGRYEYNLFKLVDSSQEHFPSFAQLKRKDGVEQFVKDSRVFNTEKECIYFLKKLIVQRLRDEGYRGKKDQMIKQTHKRVW